MPTAGIGCVAGKAGGFVRCGTGSRSSGTSTLPLCTNTLAWGLATMTRGDSAATRPDEAVNSTAGAGMALVTGRSVAGGLAKSGPAGTGWERFFCGKRGVVFALAGEPVRGGAEGFGGGWGAMVEEVDESFAALGIGLVTAVDQAGGTFAVGAGSNWLEVVIGSVEAAETFGRVAGAIFVDAGLRGLGGRLMRRVSRLGDFGSEPSGIAESAIFVVFIVISENVQWRNLQS